MEERNNYIGAAGVGRSDIQEIEVTVAGAGDRILAALLNQLFTFLVLLVPFVGLIALVIKNEGRIGSGEEMFGLLFGMTSFWVGLAGILAYTVVQIYYMSRDGQSLGKKIMRIRVLKTDGRNPGFVGTVLVAIIAAVIGLAVGDNGENAINLLAFLANFVLLFMVKRDRRTLYDMMADTVVVKLPK